MASFAKAFNVYLNGLTSVNTLVTEIQFDLSPVGKTGNRFVMTTVVDPQIKETLCDKRAGQCLVQFDAYGEERYSLHEKANDLMIIIQDLRGSIGNNFTVWKMDVTGVRSFGTMEDDQYRYLFEATVHWSLTT